MKRKLLFILTLFISASSFAQQANNSPSKQKLLSELAQNACKCIDSIPVDGESKEEIVKKINACIKDQATAYQLGSKLLGIDLLKGNNQKLDISINVDENSPDYKKYYFEMEKYLMDSCTSLKAKIALNEKTNEKSVSNNIEARKLYNQGLEETRNNNIENAIACYQKAVAIDPDFAFAWDNLGLCYRKAGKFDEALSAYKKSLEIDSLSTTPLQNIAVVYQYKKQYPEAIAIYKKLAVVNPDDPEVYYGIGRIYGILMNEYESGLDYMCKAYNLYTTQKSPYRTDAEKVIQNIYSQMKNAGKEDKFYEILKKNNITPDKK